MSTQKTPYELLGKEEGIRLLAKTFYEVMDELPEAEHIRKMHAASLVDIQEKLFEYLNGWFGGPHLYKCQLAFNIDPPTHLKLTHPESIIFLCSYCSV